MDVPLAINDIGILQGLKRYKRKSSTFSYSADVVGFLYFIANTNFSSYTWFLLEKESD